MSNSLSGSGPQDRIHPLFGTVFLPKIVRSNTDSPIGHGASSNRPNKRARPTDMLSDSSENENAGESSLPTSTGMFCPLFSAVTFKSDQFNSRDAKSA